VERLKTWNDIGGGPGWRIVGGKVGQGECMMPLKYNFQRRIINSSALTPHPGAFSQPSPYRNLDNISSDIPSRRNIDIITAQKNRDIDVNIPSMNTRETIMITITHNSHFMPFID
jgi:hypothetical protein